MTDQILENNAKKHQKCQKTLFKRFLTGFLRETDIHTFFKLKIAQKTSKSKKFKTSKRQIIIKIDNDKVLC